MRFAAILPILTFLAAIVLCFLGILAGSSPGSLQNYDLFTVNTSRITLDPEAFTLNVTIAQDTSSTGFFGSLLRNVTNQINNVTAVIEQDFEDVINRAIQSASHELGVADFYTVYTTDFCSGTYATNGSARMVQNCTSGLGLSNFNLTSIVLESLQERAVNLNVFNVGQRLQQFLRANGITLNLDLLPVGWLEKIDDGVHMLGQTVQAVYGIIVATIVLEFLALLGSVLAIFLLRTWLMAVVLVVSGLATILSLVWAVGATVVIYQAVDLVNSEGAQNNVTAAKGTGYLGIVWAAFALVLLGWIVWLVLLVRSKRAARKGHNKSHI